MVLLLMVANDIDCDHCQMPNINNQSSVFYLYDLTTNQHYSK